MRSMTFLFELSKDKSVCTVVSINKFLLHTKIESASVNCHLFVESRQLDNFSHLQW